MSSRPRLGYLVPRFPDQSHTSAWSEIAAIEDAGVDVVILSTQPPDAVRMPHDWGRVAMARTRYLGGAGVLPFLRGLPALPLAAMAGERGLARDAFAALAPAARLAGLARREGFRHVHVQGAGTGALIAALARRMGGPTVSLYLPGPLSEGGPGQNLKWQGLRFATVATARILNETRFVLRDDLPLRIAVQPQGVDTAFFRRDAAYVPLAPGGTLRLFACGVVAPGKGFQDLLAAARIILDGGQDLHLTIAGEDPESAPGHRAALAALAQELRLGSHVTLAGALDAARVRDELLAAHVFVLPSWQEPLGTALMEAMACGVPSVATAAGGVREIASDGRDALLVQPRAPAGLARAILQIAGNAELARRLSILARARSETDHDARRGALHILRETGFLPMAHDDDPIPDLPQARQRSGPHPDRR
ncbi:MAG: glycosyltransferase family 4 protein [Rubellimicrobium sp.]|nr:glycosyltransferase family 4 protein [Rubellimicrobium sp.]